MPAVIPAVNSRLVSFVQSSLGRAFHRPLVVFNVHDERTPYCLSMDSMVQSKLALLRAETIGNSTGDCDRR
jgi:hypothetical protein